MTAPHVTHVNVARPKPKMVGDRVIETAIDKHAVDGVLEVERDGLAPDDVGNPKVHGGTDRAVYSYAAEDYAWWAQELGRELRPGLFGENLTTAHADVNGALIGERWRIGSAVLAVSGPRIPCATFAAQMGERGWVRRFGAEGRPGAYLRVLEPGALRAGDEIEVLDRPDHEVTVADVARIYLRDRHEAPRMRDLPHLIVGLADWARYHGDE